jgi:hypothetical protein
LSARIGFAARPNPDAESQQALRFLIQTEEVVELGPDLVLTQAALSHAVEIVRKFTDYLPVASLMDRMAIPSPRRG